MLLLLVRTAFCGLYLDVDLRMVSSHLRCTCFLRVDELIITNAGMNTSCGSILLYKTAHGLIQPNRIKKKKRAAKQIPGRFTATITGSTLHASRLHRERIFLQSRDGSDGKCIETLTFQDSVSGYMTVSFLTTVVCKWLCTSLFIPRFLPQSH